MFSLFIKKVNHNSSRSIKKDSSDSHTVNGQNRSQSLLHCWTYSLLNEKKLQQRKKLYHVLQHLHSVYSVNKWSTKWTRKSIKTLRKWMTSWSLGFSVYSYMKTGRHAVDLQNTGLEVLFLISFWADATQFNHFLVYNFTMSF